MGTSHKLITGYAKWMREVLVDQFNLFSLFQFIGNSRIIEPGQHRAGYTTEGVMKKPLYSYDPGIQPLYTQLQNLLGVPVILAHDKWDRLYNVDFLIEVNNKYVGLQIKPITYSYTFEDYEWKEMQETAHLKFKKKFGGHVFFIFSIKSGNKKKIYNAEVIEEIRREIEILKND